MSKEKMDLIVLGRKIGKHDGWDQNDTDHVVFYDFEPAEGVDLPSGDLHVDYGSGLLKTYDDEGTTEVHSADVIDVLKNLPMAVNEMGIGTMLHDLFKSNDRAADEYYGQTIVSAEIVDGKKLLLSLSDGRVIEIWDDGQSCCEYRHMSTDDDVSSIVGGKLVRIEVKKAPTYEEVYEVHEQAFVEVATDKGFITIVNHNEHNGWYGGFGLTITELKT